ncbi:MAG: hypothetical protein ABSA44_11955 [Bacteroidota bacterium]|jgi:hypothetical protein
MSQFQIQSERLKLRNLHYWVTFGGSSGILISSVALFQLALTLTGLSVVAAGFSVYILRTLIGLGRKGWVVAYTIIVGIPFLLALVLSQSEVLGIAIWFFPLVMFYFYCWILRYSITEWLSDLGDEKAFELGEKNEKPYQDILKRFQ